MNKNFYFLKEDTQIKFIDNEFNYIPLIINGKLKGVYFKGLI